MAKAAKGIDKKSQDAANKRRSIRFQPDPNTMAHVELGTFSTSKVFRPSLTALVTEESYRGCGLALMMSKDLQVGSKMRIQVGKGAPLIGEVRWRTELDSQIMRVGIMYLE